MAPAANVQRVPALLALLGVAAIVAVLINATHVPGRDRQPVLHAMVTIIASPPPPERRRPPAPPAPAAKTLTKTVQVPEEPPSRMLRPFYKLPRGRQSPEPASPARPLANRSFWAPDAPTAAAATHAATPDYPFSEFLFWHFEVHRLVDLPLSDGGFVLVRVRLDRAGTLLDARIEQGSGSKRLDAEALALIHRAAPFPSVPGDLPDPFELVVPVTFRARDPASFATAASTTPEPE